MDKASPSIPQASFPVRLVVGHPVYSGGDLRSNRSPGTHRAGPEAAATATGPSTTTQGLAPQAMIVDTNIAISPRIGQSLTMDWPHEHPSP